jgi:hypothetical protein
VIWPWQDRAWLSGQRTFWSQQPVAHAVGGFYWPLWALGLMLVPWWTRLVWLTGGFAAWWQLLNWEPAPDGTYPFRWVVYDTLVEILVATLITAALILLGVRWP